MNAIILAAGDATRFVPALDKPKCLLNVGGASLLNRQLGLLEDLGVEQVAIVVGHLAGQIESEVKGVQRSIRVKLISNRAYHLGSALSLLCAKESLVGQVIILDGDVLFAREVLTRVWSAPAPNCLPVDEHLDDTGEEVKVVALANRRLEALGKTVAPVRGRVVGESVGMFKLGNIAGGTLSRGLELAVRDNPDVEYEPVISSLLQEIEMFYVPITDLPWIEIDFTEDLARAHKTVWPKIAALEANPA
jgi:choline kinase